MMLFAWDGAPCLKLGRSFGRPEYSWGCQPCSCVLLQNCNHDVRIEWHTKFWRSFESWKTIGVGHPRRQSFGEHFRRA